jgi:hypothetical protein
MGTCVTAEGYKIAEGIRQSAVSFAASLQQSVAVAQFALSAVDAVNNFKKLSSISSRGIAIEEQQQDRLKNVFWPREDQFLAEFTTPTAVESQSVLAKRYAGRMWAPYANVYAKELKKLECSKARYCGNAYLRAVQEVMVARGTARANFLMVADKIAQAEIEAFKDRDFTRRKDAIALYRGLIGEASSLMQAAANGLGAAGQEAANLASNALKTFAYADERRRAPDPYFHAQTAQDAMENSAGSADGRTITSTDIADAGGGGSALEQAEAGNSTTIPGYEANRVSTSSVVNAGDTLDRARGGIQNIELTIPGMEYDVKGGSGVVRTETLKTTIKLDIEKWPLVNVAGYTPSEEQIAPAELEYPQADINETFKK